MNEQDKSMMLELVGIVDEQHDLINELLKGYQPATFDSAKTIAETVKSIRLKIKNLGKAAGASIAPPDAASVKARWG